MKKAVFAGAVALAMMGPLLVSEHGIGPSVASAQEVALTEGHIYRLKRALHLTSEQMSLWHPVEAALRAALHESRSEPNNEGWVQKVRNRVGRQTVYRGNEREGRMRTGKSMAFHQILRE